ncbi:MAG: hypothetical protein ABJA20_11350 [Novosphingobium sp.]
MPLYHKIRIPLRQVLDLTVLLDQALETLPVEPRLAGELEWDIQLISLDALRDDLVQSGLSKEAKLQLLTLALPRYLWRVRSLRADKPMFDVLLDATDLLQGKLVRRIVVHNPQLCREIATVFSLMKNIVDAGLEAVIAAFVEAMPAEGL